MLSIQPAQKLLLTLGCLSLTLMQPVLAQEQILRTITVTGEGTEKINVTLAQVQLGVEIQGKNAATIQQEVAKRTTAIVELLRSRNVQQLQTSSIQLRPNYIYNNNQQQLNGYVATNLVSFQLPIEQVGRILDESINAGATRIDNVSLTATEEAINQAQKQALINATQEAQKQAEVVLKALNLNSQEVVTININGANVPSPKVIQTEAAAFRSDTVTTPVIGGLQTVRASVTLQIRY